MKLSSRLQDFILNVEDSEDATGDIAFETPSDLSIRFVFRSSFLNIGDGLTIMSHFGDDYPMQGAIEGSVAAAIGPVSHRISGGDGNGVDPGQRDRS